MEILLIEDDLTFSRIISGFLLKNDYRVEVCHTGNDGLAMAKKKKFNCILLDYRLPDTVGLEILESLKENYRSTPVIIMTSFSDIRTAVKAMKAGAFEYITKPVVPEELLMLLKNALGTTTQKKNISGDLKSVEGLGQASKELHHHIRLVAPTNLTVIVEGESGTGKEYVARSIHRLSDRADEAFVAVDCGVLSKDLAASELFGHSKGSFTGATSNKKGQFEIAHKGTLFLDEVGNLSYEVQIKLLRAIQERLVQPLGSNQEIKVDVRIITATNDDLFENAKNGRFREDLYHRLNEFKLKVPPLRERKDDLLEFMQFFRTSANVELQKNTSGFSEDLLTVFKKYDWPGNLRELKNVIKRAVLLSARETIDIDALPPEMLMAIRLQKERPHNEIFDLKVAQENQERDLIIKTLQQTKQNKSKAARLLNIDRKTLYMKIEKYKIE